MESDRDQTDPPAPAPTLPSRPALWRRLGLILLLTAGGPAVLACWVLMVWGCWALIKLAMHLL